MKLLTCLMSAVVVGGTSAAYANAASEARENAEIRKIMFSYAACVVKKRHARAADAILSNANTSEILKQYPDLISGECMEKVAGDVKVTFVGDFYRYALADALVNADFAKEGPADFSDKLPLAHLPELTAEEIAKAESAKSNIKRRKIEENSEKYAVISRLSRYGECVVRQDPPNARLWLLTKPDVPEEISRINALRPAFAACLVGTLAFGKATMRGTVAINYYRLAMATPQPGLGKTH